MITARLSMTAKDEDKKVEAWMMTRFHGYTKEEVEKKFLDKIGGEFTWKVEFVKEE